MTSARITDVGAATAGLLLLALDVGVQLSADSVISSSPMQVAQTVFPGTT